MLEKVINKILDFVEPDEEITAASTLKGDCGLSSFDTVCLVEELCNELGIEEGSVSIRECRTVADLVESFEKQQA